jgi:hypothetical protein
MDRQAMIIILALIGGLLFSNPIYAQKELGLLIIAHGSPMPQWNKPVLELEVEVTKLFSERESNPFSKIRVALMEFNEPSVNTVIKGFEDSGIDRVYAIPLFVAPSGHSLYDVPTILGLYSDKETVESIKEEGTTVVDAKMRITVGPTLKNGTVLKEIMLDRVNDLSTVPDSEGVVILAHGDSYFEPIWESMCREIGSHICAKTGIDYFDYAFVGIGQSFISKGVPVILRTADKCSRTIVVGLYLSMGVDNMAENSVLSVGMMEIESKKIFDDRNIHFTKQGLLPDKRVAQWIVDRAVEWVEGLP